MSYVNLLEQDRSGQIDRRTLVRGLAALVAPAIGLSLVANATLAGGKKGKRSRKLRKSGKKQSRGGRGGASAQGCGGGCK